MCQLLLPASPQHKDGRDPTTDSQHCGLTLHHLRYLLPCLSVPREQELTRVLPPPTLQDHKGAGEAPSLERHPDGGETARPGVLQGQLWCTAFPSSFTSSRPQKNQLFSIAIHPADYSQSGRLCGLQTRNTEAPAATCHVTAPASRWVREEVKLNYLLDPFG